MIGGGIGQLPNWRENRGWEIMMICQVCSKLPLGVNVSANGSLPYVSPATMCT